MIILFYLLIFAIVLILCFCIKNVNILITILCTILIGQIILTPKICIDGVITGALLFFYKVFPSLFSFLVVSNIILSYDGVYIYSRVMGKFLCKPLKLPVNCSFVLIISMLCGYPLGAKYACELHEKKLIDLPTCERLLNIASNASPLFVLGSVGISMLNNSSIGYILLLSNLLSCLIMGFLIPSRKPYRVPVQGKKHVYARQNIGKVLKGSIENAIKNCMSIGGFVIIFSVVNNILKNNFLFNLLMQQISKITGISCDIIEGSILGMIEMTNGCNLISSSTASLTLKIIIVSFLFTFSGASIVSQVYSFTYKFKISMKKYVVGKIFQGIICSILSFSIYTLFSGKLSEETFLPYYKITGGPSSIFIVLLALLILPWLLFKSVKLFHIP
ncbi:sporulation integral membrane protein YlbJ [uncultured Clostridium sp.]|uniref:sporulation integral membrane protein YlbJ n=1 Tax=uncultured Clostridium sp. TaxID=59620 RepID=UPI0025E81CE9|nr:sporulation integral membrane protein YlbJ [uncultured Clostridium sp.]NLU07293.1 sporulation integral membrane protein YlbJ [Clostridiales bacterium]